MGWGGNAVANLHCLRLSTSNIFESMKEQFVCAGAWPRLIRHAGRPTMLAFIVGLGLAFLPSNSFAQTAGSTCSLGKAAKLFKEQSGMAFHTKLKAGQDVSLIKQVGTRWEVAAPDGTIGYLDAAWMNKICWYTDPTPKRSTQASADAPSKPAPSQVESAPDTAPEAAPETAPPSAPSASASHGHSKASPPGKDYQPKRGIGSMALLPIEGERLDPGLAKVCSNLIAAHLGKVPGRTLVTADEISAMLSLEEQKMALACDDSSCMAEIGGALGVDELIRVSLGTLGDQLVISMSRILVAEAAILGRSTIQVENNENNYNQGFARAVAEIYQLDPPQPAAAPTQSTMGALTKTERTTPVMGYVGLALGAAALGGGAYFGLQAQTNADEANSLELGSHQAASDAKGQALMANVLYGVGAVGIAAGLYFWLSGDEPSAQASVSRSEERLVTFTTIDLEPIIGGALLSVGGTY